MIGFFCSLLQKKEYSDERKIVIKNKYKREISLFQEINHFRSERDSGRTLEVHQAETNSGK